MVAPETTRLEGEWEGEPFWLEVKRRLTDGEDRAVKMAGFEGIITPAAESRPRRLDEAPRETKIPIDFKKTSYVRTLTYVVDWSLTDDHSNKLPRTYEVLAGMDPDGYAAIEALLNAHVTAIAEEKKLRSGSLKPRAISA